MAQPCASAALMPAARVPTLTLTMLSSPHSLKDHLRDTPPDNLRTTAWG